MTTSDPNVVISDIETDVLIVGAGMAGLYSAWRLTRAGRKVRIVEQLHRTGGRLQTDHLRIQGETVQAEEGGMRFLQTQHELHAVMRQLKLSGDIVPFPMGDYANLYYLHGRRFTAEEARANPAIWSWTYPLDVQSANKQPGQILWDIRNEILLQNGQDLDAWQSPSPEYWTDFRLKYRYKDVPMYRWGFWALLEDYGLSRGCIEMLYQSSGFIAPFDQQINAGCAFQLVADFINPTFFTLGSGYATLPSALQAELEAHRVPIDLQHEVQHIERRDDGRLQVVARCGERQITLVCRTLILAITQVALRRLAYYSPVLREDWQFMADIESVADMPLGKINLYYEENWWTPRLGIRDGPCFTDLPLAQVYFFEPAGGTGSGGTGPGHITVYTDYYRAGFWAQLQAMGEPFQSERFPKNPPNTEAASRFVVSAATRQMKEMFGLADLPEPVLSTYKAWLDPRTGDGDHQWRINVLDTEVRRRLACPVPDIHVCGESYSDDQAWVNGALRSADDMLAAHFGLQRITAQASGPADGA